MHYFDIGRRVRQGDPLSAYLFITVIEMLSIGIRGNRSNEGILVNGKELSWLGMRMTWTLSLKIIFLLKWLISLESVLESNLTNQKLRYSDLVQQGGQMSTISSNLTTPPSYPKCWASTLRDAINFDSTLESIKKLLAQWKRRGLTIMEKI